MDMLLLGLEQGRVFQGLKMWPRGRGRGGRMSLYQQCFSTGLSSQIVTVSLCRDWIGSFLGGVTLWCSSYHTLSGYHGEEETCKSEHQSLHRALRLWYSETKRVDVNLAYTAQVYACFVHTVSEVRFPVTNMAGTQFPGCLRCLPDSQVPLSVSACSAFAALSLEER